MTSATASARTLTDADVDAIAARLAELLDARATPTTKRWLTAADVAQLAGRSRQWVYEHAEELGGVPLPGGGMRPRLQFDGSIVEERLATGSSSRRRVVAAGRMETGQTSRRRSGRKGTTRHLLPIAGEEAHR